MRIRQAAQPREGVIASTRNWGGMQRWVPTAIRNPISHVHVRRLSALGPGARNAANHAFEGGKVLVERRSVAAGGGGAQGWAALRGSHRPQHLGLAPPGARDLEPGREAVPGEPAGHRDRGHAPRQ